ncbi:trypsin-like peptidase domain-containing protein [Gelidibacter maritimus]|uniref:Trypsin-like peptidase domain-containing protein n=1 Tax=Gelidibacter maritimus TaxID=2761487 RepID=A0A7W2M8A6_9FLAO|nr:trypsin-like peptidase domain-containing protein [Gelidibacter maritimus]MBA6154561.1 trypsin-like peptidase domain-containing protein [Gelidibacter maritimus]
MKEQEISMLIRHIAGSKKGQVEKISVANTPEVRIGRGMENNVSFDPVKEDTISRDHCRIVQDTNSPERFWIFDCQSKNGTFVNDVHTTSKTELFAGDIVKLGKEGPSFEFDLDPRPQSHIKKTRVIDAVPAKETKVHTATNTPRATSEKTAPVKEGIGKNTMQHMIRESEKKGKTGLVITIIAFLLLAATGGYLLYKKQSVKEIVHVREPKTTFTPTEIAKTNNDKVVYVEMAWKLTSTESSEEMYHVYFPIMEDKQIMGHRGAYVQNQQGNIEPLLVTKGDYLRALGNTQGIELDLIAGKGTGSGFVIDERGFIATNRHVATSWFTSFTFQQYAFPGVLVEPNKNGQLAPAWEKEVTQQMVGRWVPGNDERYTGINTYLDVTFANNSQRTPAKIVRVSSTHDIAMIKIDLPESLSKVELYDSYNEIQPGDAAIVMGYPGMSPAQLVLKRSQDYFNTNPNITSVPVPTISTGNVGRMVRGSEKNDRIDDYQSSFGDYYQLTINSSGGGNSGGPMFDDKGRAVGVYSAGTTDGRGNAISFAVPIKYVMELMGRQQVIK